MSMSKINIHDDLKNQPSEKIEAIKKILPDCFDKDGNLISEKLKEVLTNNFEKPDTERFTFNWAGKQKAREIAYKSYLEGTLKFNETKSKNFNDTENLIIEGDNLQVLKLLKNSYKGKVKCIYIDPPYNTGNDFVYNDNFELSIKQYLIDTGEIDEETGEQIADYIQKDDGKKHSKWLSFMYPRLMVARELLREDGVIFISIDDNEVHHLRLLMNEVFGEGNCTENIIWESKTKSQNTKSAYNKLQPKTEYILVYSKLSKDSIRFNLISTGQKDYPESDKKGSFRYKLVEEMNATGIRGRESMVFDICGIKPREGKQWQIGQETVTEYQNREDIEIRDDKVFLKQRPEDERNETTSPFWALLSKEIGTTESAKQDLNKLMNEDNIFDTVKPVNLIKTLVFHATKPNDLVLDFFAGSGTTGQAVMELNQEEIDKQSKDGLLADKETQVGGRKFILVQLPEKIDSKKEAFKAGYKKISEITMERVRRAGEKYKDVDNGFKVLELADNPDRESLWNLGNLNDNQFILTHLALMYGYGLNYKVEKIHEKEIYKMQSEFPHTKDAIIIMEQSLLTMDDVLSLIKDYGNGNYKFFSRDCALSIELTYNLLQHFKENNVIVF